MNSKVKEPKADPLSPPSGEGKTPGAAREPREGPVLFLAAIALIVMLGFGTLAAMTLSLILYPPPQPGGNGTTDSPGAQAPANPAPSPQS